MRFVGSIVALASADDASPNALKMPTEVGTTLRSFVGRTERQRVPACIFTGRLAPLRFQLTACAAVVIERPLKHTTRNHQACAGGYDTNSGKTPIRKCPRNDLRGNGDDQQDGHDP